MTLKSIESAALKLPPKDRSILAAKLLSSLDAADAPELEQAWLAEAEQRLAAHKKGKMSSIPATQAIAAARKALLR